MRLGPGHLGVSRRDDGTPAVPFIHVSIDGRPGAVRRGGPPALRGRGHLLTQQRHVTADHLAGLAVECLLKAILVDFLHVTLSPKGFPQAPDATGQLTTFRHLPKLWNQVAAHPAGRAGAQFIALFTATNLFAGWDISDRYTDGSAITEQRSTDHVEVAASVARIHEQAQLNGSVP